MPLLLLLLSGATVGAGAAVVVSHSLDGVNETVSNTSNAISSIGNTALLLGGLYVFAKWKKFI